jgi:drug/metabolite transporter (DMT)-like permease
MTTVPSTTGSAITRHVSARWTGAGLVAVSAAGFATLSVFGKVGLSGGMTLAGMMSLRFGGAAVLLGLGFLAVRRRPPDLSTRSALGLLAMGVFGYGVQSTLYFNGLQRVPASICALLLYVYPLLVALYDRLFNHRRLRWTSRAGLVLALIGVTLTVRPSAATALDPLGLAFVAGSAAWYAGYIIVSERIVLRHGAWVSTVGISAGAAIAFTLGGWVTRTLDWHFGREQLLLIVGLVLVSTILPLATFLAGVARLGPTTASIVSTLEPVFTALLAAWVLREQLSPIQMGGGALILGAAAIVQWPAKVSG